MTKLEQPDLWTEHGKVLPLLREQLPEYLRRQRWYPAKNAGAPLVRLAALIPFDTSTLASALAIWTATPPGEAAISIFLPIAIVERTPHSLADAAVIARLQDGSQVLSDAFAIDEFVREFVRFTLRPTALPPLRSAQTAQAAQLAASAPEWPIRRSSVEQSNTSIRVGDGAMLKVIRKLVSGTHPELEMGRVLTERLEPNAVPALLAWLDLDEYTLAILQSFVPNQGDGWTWINDRLREGSDDSDATSLQWIQKLGERTADMHLALAAPTRDPDFSPDAATPEDWLRWVDDIAAMAQRAGDGLRRCDATMDTAARAAAREFAARRSDLTQRLATLVPCAAIAKTRHHGDFHLGQVLVRGGDVTIVDFEGEPLRPLAERRAKHIPLRDVAGMLRSFAYAAAVVARDLPPEQPARERTLARLNQWVAAASTAYIGSYLQKTLADDDCHDAAATAQAIRIIQLFTIEKALYEVLYELANRPAWVRIPLSNVSTLLDQVDAPDGASRCVRRHRLPQGAEIEPDGRVRFRLWGPGCEHIRIAFYESGAAEPARIVPMIRSDDGWHEWVDPHARAGERYHFVLPDETRVPDPASRFQPEDVHGPSEIIDPSSYAWQDRDWAGRPWHEAVVYELHIGAFTPAGTFRAAIDHLDHLVALGVTALEIMPVADFPGGRNWGYDGVLLYAPDASYGRPEDFKALVDAAHARGLMVLLDVVYNHFGPDGNYLPVYAPPFFTDRHKTPWGAAINYDGPHSRPVREFIIHNALYWIDEFHLDGLRLDAVHAIIDDGVMHVLDELAERVRADRRPIHLILENEENQASRLLRGARGVPLHYTAQWNDDLHHVLHVAVTGEDAGYYADYLDDAAKLGRALAEGFAFQGELMEFRGKERGEPCAMLPPTAFVSFIQNHDQIGNRAFGERLTALAAPEALRAIVSIYLLLPQVPMLFMGEEWGAAQPFPFFCDFDGELAEAVRRGRREEFAKFPQFRDEAVRAQIPDPQADATFQSAKLDWGDLDTPEHAARQDFYRRILTVRRGSLIPLLPHIGGQSSRTDIVANGALVVRWQIEGQGELTLCANLSKSSVTFPAIPGRTLWQVGDMNAECDAGPWFVRWSIA